MDNLRARRSYENVYHELVYSLAETNLGNQSYQHTLYQKAIQALAEQHIPYRAYTHDKYNYIFLAYAQETYVSVFYNSDNPVKWKEEQTKKENEKKVKKVEKKLDSR